jgi:methyltransferase
MVNPALQLYLGFLGAVVLERLAEMVLSARNARRAFRRGAVEAGRGHYPPMVAFHLLFLVACAAEALGRRAPPPLPLAAGALVAALAAQGLRWWAVATLGDRWNTRIIAVPGDPPVTRGPYRFARHPNYLAVVIEMAAIPLAYGSWRTALAFSLGNAVLLAVRIPAEERALGAPYAKAFAGRPRLVPGARR